MNRYNRQLHEDEQQKLAQMKRGRSAAEQQRLEDAPCYRVQCAAQMSDANPDKAAALASQQRGEKYLHEQLELESTGQFVRTGFEHANDIADRAGDALLQQAKSVGREVSHAGDQFVGLLKENNGKTAPSDANPLVQANNGTPPNTGASPVTPPLVICEPPVCTVVPGSPGARLPSNAMAAETKGPTGADERTDNHATNMGQPIIDGKIGGQLEGRGWTQQEVQAVVNEGPVGTTMDSRSSGKTPDGLPRNDPASVYGTKNGYVVVNDRTGEVVQVSGKNDPGWIPDSRIKWK